MRRAAEPPNQGSTCRPNDSCPFPTLQIVLVLTVGTGFFVASEFGTPGTAPAGTPHRLGQASGGQRDFEGSGSSLTLEEVAGIVEQSTREGLIDDTTGALAAAFEFTV